MRALINYDAFSIFLVDREKQGAAPPLQRPLRPARATWTTFRWERGLPARRRNRGSRCGFSIPAPIRAISPSHPDIRSELAVPLIVQDRVVGVLDLESERIAYFTEDHQRTLSLLAPQIASSVENARLYEELAQREQRMEQDLKAARKLQRVLLPREAPEIAGWRSAIRSRPAREISGDVYDFFEQGETHAVIAFGDVSGKGAAAALYGALIERSAAHSRAAAAQSRAADASRSTNRFWSAKWTRSTPRCWWRYGSRPRAVWSMANAGSEPPLVWRRRRD